MDTNSRLEQELSNALRASARLDPVSEEFVSRALRAGQRSQHRRRFAYAGAAVAAATVLVASATVVPRMLEDAQTGRDSAAVPNETVRTRQSADPETLFAWARGLPLGAAPDSTYLAGTRLVSAGGTLPLDGTDADLVGAIDGGYLVLLEREEENPYSFYSGLVRVATNGSTTRLPAGEGGVQGEVISPDGSLVAYGRHVVRVSDLAVVADLPGEATLLEGWSDHGIVFYDDGGSAWLWQPGQDPRPLSERIGGRVSASGRTFIASGGCSVVQEIAASGEVSRLLENCGLGRPLSLSPSGDALLTSSGTFVAVPSGGEDDFGPGGPIDEVGTYCC